MAKAEHRVEECLKRGKSEAGLGDYQVRNWLGWHHHRALSLIATWFLVVEAGRGKKEGAGVDGAAGACGAGVDPAPGQPLRYAEAGVARERTRWLERNESARFYHYKARNQLAPLKISQNERLRQ